MDIIYGTILQWRTKRPIDYTELIILFHMENFSMLSGKSKVTKQYVW